LKRGGERGHRWERGSWIEGLEEKKEIRDNGEVGRGGRAGFWRDGKKPPVWGRERMIAGVLNKVEEESGDNRGWEGRRVTAEGTERHQAKKS